MYIHPHMYVHAETMWMHANTTHPQTNSGVERENDGDDACMLSAEADHNYLERAKR